MTRTSFRQNPPRGIAFLLTALTLVALPTPASAYIGPGAGFALISSFLVVFTTIILAIVAVFLMPFRLLLRVIRRRPKAKPWIRRLIIVGLDGQDPRLTEQLMQEGKLPNFSRLRDMGCYRRLRTTYPPLSPTAWSSFSTGTHPAKHNIYDFLSRDPRTYLPRLSSTDMRPVDRVIKLGSWRIPLRKPEIRLLRKSKATWTILGEHNVWSTVLRVPITFPPEKFYGAQLSAMCVPDLLGSQGTFLLYTTRPSEMAFKEGGLRIALEPAGDRFETIIKGPENTFLEGNPPLELPMRIEIDRRAKKACVVVNGEKLALTENKLSGWLTLHFPVAPGIKVSGNCRMMVTELGEHFSLYVTPINIDPENPAMPISHPGYYSTYLAKKIGAFCTLGLAEDTWALNEGVIDDSTFLKQAYDIDAERQAMFFAALDRLRRGTLTCVFDATDRIQHMFWRYVEKDHPAARGAAGAPHADAIERIYTHNDALVGSVMEKLRKGDLLLVISDHGFASFRRGINLNVWLQRNGYLTLKAGADGSTAWLRDVDWSATRAYALGLTGMYVNLKGREVEGIVRSGQEAETLKAEIISKLNGLVDPEKDEVAITEVFDTAKIYTGPYLPNAPDFLIGYNRGYRASWDLAMGVVSGGVFEDNVKAWSGDHCIDPRLVPGVFFANRKIASEDPSLVDIAPSILRMFGLEPPAHMDGKALFEEAAFL